MFTGIVQHIGVVHAFFEQKDAYRLLVEFPVKPENLLLGSSVAVNGVCLTVVAIDNSATVTFDVVAQTYSQTNLSSLKKGVKVNLERAITPSMELGGSMLSGHIMGISSVLNFEEAPKNKVLRCSIEDHFAPYLFDKGFISLNGVSLTIAKIDAQKHWFEVHLIPETLSRSIFSGVQVGSALNVEVDSVIQATVDTVRNFLKANHNNL